MFRFSCFHAHANNSHKPKKMVQPSSETVHKTLQDIPQIQAPKPSSDYTVLNSSAQPCSPTGDCSHHVTSSPISVERGWKSEEIKGKLTPERDTGFLSKGRLMKSQSLGSGLCLEGRNHGDNNTEDETDQEFSSSVLPEGSRDPGVSPSSEHRMGMNSDSIHISSDHVDNIAIFSIGDTQHLEKGGQETSDNVLSGEHANDSGDPSPRSPLVIVKSHSLCNLGHLSPTSGKCSPFKPLVQQSRSSDDLHVLNTRQKEISTHEFEARILQEQEYEKEHETDKNNFEASVDDGYNSYNYSAVAKDWIIPATNEVFGKNIQGESSFERWQEFPSKNFKIKRIEEWVNDLQYCSPLEEANESSPCNNQVNGDSTVSNGLTTSKVDSRVTPSMEAAKRYISSLSAFATTAQLSNHGLVVIPFLSTFVSLRALNLSGNAIVRITAGALPRGLHVLNLSKNSITTIEGLRELTRLRVLDLSYNRILRIGHGLASCSSLKELYLAGNKISEVEGLHRLLKLTVLDLRFNKISTAKCLGQLAANYNSLQAISLEGNPAQKNVGDEQLKKTLQGLLPHLVYFNRQPIKVSTLKDVADRAVRLGISARQGDRGLRLENKGTRKAGHGLAAQRPSSSSTLGRKSQAVVSPKRSRGRRVRLPPPPSGTKATTGDQHHHYDFGDRLLNLKSELSIRRSRSEGTLGAL
ncbi:uncharacterized protein LOC120007559 [Tripterygium wilfordii]|nr:uncharacterized protein LOC120007559 [Tripterygium wilfordii]